MANVRGRTSGMAMGERLPMLTPTREKIVPASGWSEDSDGHYLLVDLQGFKKDKVKLEMNTTAGHITVTGEAQVNQNQFKYFEENFTIPANSDVDKITGKFDGEILYVTVPKVVAVVEERKEPEIVQEKKEAEIVQNQNIEGAAAAENTQPRAPNNNDGKNTHKDDGTNDAESNKLLGNTRILFSPEKIRKWEDDNGILRSAMEVLNKQKGVIITAILAFSLGMLVSRKFETGQ